MATLPLFLVTSKWSLERISAFLAPFGGARFLRIVFDGRTGRETDRTLAVLDEEVFAALSAAGYARRGGDIAVSRYAVHPEQLPPAGDPVIFVRVPEGLARSEGYVVAALEAKLADLAAFGVIPAGSWRIRAPLASRSSGKLRGGCFVDLAGVAPERAAAAKVVLTDSAWGDGGGGADGALDPENALQCAWAHPRPARRGRKSAAEGAVAPGVKSSALASQPAKPAVEIKGQDAAANAPAEQKAARRRGRGRGRRPKAAAGEKPSAALPLGEFPEAAAGLIPLPEAIAALLDGGAADSLDGGAADSLDGGAAASLDGGAAGGANGTADSGVDA